jgi:predicted dehydrogenase
MGATTEDRAATVRLRAGVIGTGVIGQVMHLHFLRELTDRYEIAAVCDISAQSAAAAARDYGAPGVFTDWREMVASDLDVVLILTSGSHAPIAIEAARSGRHVFTEKPMCFSTAEAREMIHAASAAGVVMMVGYPKRYDPAFARFREAVAELSEPRLLRVTTTESPFQPYVSHYPLHPPSGDVDEGVIGGLRADTRARLVAAIGTEDEFLVNQYQNVLLDTLIHEINTTRGVLGEPDRLDYVDLRPGSLTAVLNFGSVTAAIHWVDTPGMTRYSMEFAMMAADGRAVLTFPSPYLRNAATELTIEGGPAGGMSSFKRVDLTSYESGFKAELAAFHAAVTGGETPPTDAADGARDIAVCQAIIRSMATHAPVERPSQY